MGYTTEFSGSIEITPALNPEMISYINQFSGTRRMKRDSNKLMEKHQGKFGLNGSYGVEGEYFVGGEGFAGQNTDETVLSNNYPPSTQPGLWCQWIITDDGKWIEWDGGEKFYESVEWMKYILTNFLKDYDCNGEIKAQGEEFDDRWKLIVENSKVRVVGLE